MFRRAGAKGRLTCMYLLSIIGDFGQDSNTQAYILLDGETRGSRVVNMVSFRSLTI